MPVSKKRSKVKSRKANKKNKLIKKAKSLPKFDISELNVCGLKDLSDEYLKDAYILIKDRYKEIEYKEKTNIYSKLMFINIIIKSMYGNKNYESSLFGVLSPYGEIPTFTINIIPYIHNLDMALISEFNLICNKDMDDIENLINPIPDILRLADILELDLGFPIYETGDVQEEFFRDYGFIDSNLKSNPGEKILLRKYNKRY